MQTIPTRTIFIGDVHGCFSEMISLIKKLNISQSDRVFFTWDLISKWPKSIKVLKYVYKNKINFFSVQWNKELELLKSIETNKYYSNSEKKLWKKLIEKYPDILEYLKNLPYFIDEKYFLLIHGWIVPWIKIEEQWVSDLCYLRDYKGMPWYNYYSDPKPIFYWHWAQEGLKIRKNTFWLDSWCVYWWKLSAYILETQELVQVDALKIYKNPYKSWTTKYFLKKLSFKLKKYYENR